MNNDFKPLALLARTASVQPTHCIVHKGEQTAAARLERAKLITIERQSKDSWGAKLTTVGSITALSYLAELQEELGIEAG